jgi:uncharacterized protein YuzE
MLSTAYDADADALYIAIHRGTVARTECLDDWTLVDLDATGAAIGIEVIHPARAWPLQKFLDQFKIAGPTRNLLEDMFPAANRSRRAAFAAPDVELDSDAQNFSLAL